MKVRVRAVGHDPRSCRRTVGRAGVSAVGYGCCPTDPTCLSSRHGRRAANCITCCLAVPHGSASLENAMPTLVRFFARQKSARWRKREPRAQRVIARTVSREKLGEFPARIPAHGTPARVSREKLGELPARNSSRNPRAMPKRVLNDFGKFQKGHEYR